MRRAIVAVLVLIGVAAGGFGLGYLVGHRAVALRPSALPSVPPRTVLVPKVLTGEALAEALGLELQSSWTPGCAHYVEVEESGAGYCLDAAVRSNFEAWDVGNRLRELERSDLDRRIFMLADQIAQASEAGDPETVERLSAEVQILIEERSNLPPEPDPYPRGAFEWCPDPPFPEGGQDWSEQASAVALRFVGAYAAGDDAAAAELLDSSVPNGAEFPIELAQGAEPSVLSTNAWGGPLVEFGCGRDAAAYTVAIMMDDGTSSASLDFIVDLVFREDGWRVWAVY
jgi:hypothetical protein